MSTNRLMPEPSARARLQLEESINARRQPEESIDARLYREPTEAEVLAMLQLEESCGGLDAILRRQRPKTAARARGAVGG